MSRAQGWWLCTFSEYGWLSKLWSLFGHPKYQVPYYNRDSKGDHNFDIHPYSFGVYKVNRVLRI